MATKRITNNKQLELSLDRFDGQSLISLGLGVVVVIVVGLLVFNYFTQLKNQPAVIEKAEEEVISPPEQLPSQLPTTHIVQAGEHLWGLAEKYYQNGFLWVKIAQANNLSTPDRIFLGMVLKIPEVDGKTQPPTTQEVVLQSSQEEPITASGYTVQEGDNLCKIGRRAYGQCQRGWEIARANRLKNPHLIYPGLELVIPRTD